MTSDFSFNLLDEPWIPYVDLNGRPGQGSVLDVLINAHEIRDLTTDVPTQYPTILRLLLTYVHRALPLEEGREIAFPESKEDWQDLHQEGILPRQSLVSYADIWRYAFDLFSEKQPFMQFTEEDPNDYKIGPSSLLISYDSAGRNAPIFSPTWDASPTALAPAEAARWLLHTHAWDTAGTKTGAAGDRAAKNGKAYGNRVGPLGELGILIPTGDSLFETLLYNLLVQEGETALPVWERTPLTAEWSSRQPQGSIDLYTWPSRRIRLFPELRDGETVVAKAMVAAGDRIDDTGNALSANEPHTAWRKYIPSKQAAIKERSRSDRRPLRHTPGQELWRGLGGILGWDQGLQRTNDLKPRVLIHLNHCFDPDEDEELPVLRLRAFGMVYGVKDAIIEDTYTDTLPLPVALMMEGDTWDSLGSATVSCVADTEKAAQALGRFAADLAFAEGGGETEEAAAGDRVRRQFFADLDHRFRSWLSNVRKSDLAEEYSRQWRSTAYQQAKDLAEDLIVRSGSRTLRTRYRKPKTSTQKLEGVNRIFARRNFYRQLHTHLGTEAP